jgi:hypothetical protein
MLTKSNGTVNLILECRTGLTLTHREEAIHESLKNFLFEGDSHLDFSINPKDLNISYIL